MAERNARGSSRGLLPGLPSPAPLIHRLPGVLQDDDFTQRFVSAFDEGYAPILTTLDSLACYFDPRLAPADFVDYLAGWVGIELVDSWTVEQRREIVAGAAPVHRRRGTRRGIEEALALAFGATVTVKDSGGCAWSVKSGGDLPGSAPARVEVTLEVDDPVDVDPRRVDSVLDATKPAHVAHRVTVTKRPQPPQAPEPPKAPPPAARKAAAAPASDRPVPATPPKPPAVDTAEAPQTAPRTDAEEEPS